MMSGRSALTAAMLLFLTLPAAQGQPDRVERMLQRFDRDQDGKISRAEAPPPMLRRFERMDADGDGTLSRKELENGLPRRPPPALEKSNGKRPPGTMNDSLEAGSAAPDFTLSGVEGNAAVRLSDLYREKPVVLIFGSCT